MSRPVLDHQRLMTTTVNGSRHSCSYASALLVAKAAQDLRNQKLDDLRKRKAEADAEEEGRPQKQAKLDDMADILKQ